ncbi:MAG: 5'-nucleotidase C-terminal domain-containing protein [Bacillota bacterium]|jgi:5'-nucleotidase|nr:bifunctional metallophosphatase/5'-nucleotidase [Bacillota bacterium]HOB90764.1 5'-nucleotidase C-terminal domain-containing protein [Bacillota bacterium]HPZ54055.1 5'-nucleotidase C-terminal domain-containing protein [Bacillota bacterium]HQD17526.1 5'-nucleotidase C-terminal domain-containing protein [Bacillota bacterium]
MKKRARLLSAVCLLIALVVSWLVPGDAGLAFAEDGLVCLQILAINDLHGHIEQTEYLDGRPVGGVAYLATYMLEREADAVNTLRVHAGDMIGASPPISGLLQDQPTIEVLSFMGFDVGVPGNHEFDEGIAELYRLQYGGFHEVSGYFAGSSFPLGLANLVSAETGGPVFPPYVVKVVEGVPVAFICVITEELPASVTPAGIQGLKVIDPVEVINTYAEIVRDRGVEAIVVLAHEGGYVSSSGEIVGPIAKLAHGIDDSVDVIISAHTHQGYVGYIDGKLVTQAYSNGTAFVDIDLLIDRATGDVVSSTAELVTVWSDMRPPDPRIEALIDRYRPLVEALVNRPVAVAATRLGREGRDQGESVLGNLVADSKRWISKAQIAFVNPGGLRSDLEPGILTWGQLYAVLPFGNEIVKIEMTGEQILSALNQQWQETEDGVQVRFLQMSGMTYCYDDSLPIGNRIVSASLSDGTQIGDEQVYTVAVNSFLYYGGNGFTAFLEGRNPMVVANDLDAFVAYLESFAEPIALEIEGRITRCLMKN